MGSVIVDKLVNDSVELKYSSKTPEVWRKSRVRKWLSGTVTGRFTRWTTLGFW